MEYTIYRLGDIAEVKISGVDKKTHDEEVPVRLCNFVDVYYNWAITKEMTSKFMAASANNKEIESFTLHRGQVAITKDSETRDDIGIAAYIADDFEETVLLGYHTALITPNEEVVNGKYLNALLHSKYFHDYWFNNATGSGMRYTLSEQCIRNASIYLPSLDEQKKIGNILSSLDHKIALNRKANELLESMAKQLYDYWFVQFDFPNAEGKPYKSSGGKMVYNEILKRDIPDGWEVGNLFEVSNLLTGGTPSKAVDDYWQGGTIPFFGPTDCDGSTFQFTTEYRITEAGVSHSAAKVMNENCVIITARGSIGKYVITGIPMAMNQSCFAFEAKDGNYAHLYFLVGQLIQHLLVKGSGSTFKSIVGIDIENSILCLGEPNVRKAFERIVRPMFEKIKSNTQETLRLTSLRDYLLPLLMNGQVKVS